MSLSNPNGSERASATEIPPRRPPHVVILPAVNDASFKNIPIEYYKEKP
jgi:hypothetical protein